MAAEFDHHEAMQIDAFVGVLSSRLSQLYPGRTHIDAGTFATVALGLLNDLRQGNVPLDESSIVGAVLQPNMIVSGEKEFERLLGVVAHKVVKQIFSPEDAYRFGMQVNRAVQRQMLESKLPPVARRLISQ